jgi:hypothetical protein
MSLEQVASVSVSDAKTLVISPWDKGQLQAIEKGIQLAKDTDDAFAQVIQLFNACSVEHDSISDYSIQRNILSECKQDNEALLLDQLIDHIANAGRDRFGINRTKSGETVTMDNVHWRPIHGLNTKTLSYWAGYKDEKKGGWGFKEMDHMNAYDVIKNDAKTFSENHIDPILELISKIQSW